MPNDQCFEVIYTKGDEETRYLVAAYGPRDACRNVLETIHGDGGNRTLATFARDLQCSVTARLFLPEVPYRLYTLNKRTGAMR